MSLFGQAVMFFTRSGWVGLKLKGSPYHLLVGFTPEGMSVHKTIERTGLHVPVAEVSNEELGRGFGVFFSEVLHNEIDPTAAKFRNWTVLIPKTSPDTPLARRLILEHGRNADATLEPLINMGPVRALHATNEVLSMRKVKARRFKWATAYPTLDWREFSPRRMRWLYHWYGRYYMISDRKRSTLLSSAFNLANAPTKNVRSD
jgi:hypothetical protein